MSTDKVEKTETIEPVVEVKKERIREKKNPEVEVLDQAPVEDAVVEVIEARSQPVSDELDRAV